MIIDLDDIQPGMDQIVKILVHHQVVQLLKTAGCQPASEDELKSLNESHTQVVEAVYA